MIGFRITPGIATIIGAAAAIIGGLLVAIYTSQRTRRLALELRAIERQEEALLKLAAVVSEISGRFTVFKDTVGGNPQQPAAEAAERHAQLLILWNQELSCRVRDGEVRAGAEEVINALELTASGGTTDWHELTALIKKADAVGASINRVLDRRR